MNLSFQVFVNALSQRTDLTIEAKMSAIALEE